MHLLSLSPEFYLGSHLDLFRTNTSFIDVRSPLEFSQGAFPHTQNLPILDNDQRHLIGCCYKEQGQEAAIELGFALVSDRDRDEKIGRWLAAMSLNPQCVLYCFRGGLRSQIAQDWIRGHGKNVPIIRGGYKQLRKDLLENLEEQLQHQEFLVIGGQTGSGKTRVIQSLSKTGYPALDLEELANHRGSVFGQRSGSMPSQVDFENRISITLLHLSEVTAVKKIKILVEDESATIGPLILPLSLLQKKNHSPFFIMEVPLEQRVQLIFEEYVQALSPTISAQDLLLQFQKSFMALKKRIGNALFQDCMQILTMAIEAQIRVGDLSLHRGWIRKLLVHYYDPIYQKRLKVNQDMKLIVGGGDQKSLRSYLAHYRQL